MEDRRQILIVEDSPMQAKRLKRLLEAHGYEVVLAYNGMEGLAAARENQFSLIVSDVIMPEMDGYQMCREIKRDRETTHIPVILLTSLSNPDDVFLGLESGADSYMSKPYEPDVLISRIESVLSTPKIRKADDPDEGLEVWIGPKRYLIRSSRHQILNLLLSTYQDAVDQNRNLREMRTKLVMVNEELQTLVNERTQALTREIEDRKRIEEALASEKESLSVTLRTILDGVITTNTEGEVILMNRAAEEFTGWPREEAIGRHITSVCNLIKTETKESGETAVANILKSGGFFGVGDEITIVSRGGTERIVVVSGTPILDAFNKIIGVILVLRDITDSKRIEEELVKAQKLESLGVLAGGIAHDFNNLLTAILGNVSLAKIHSSPGGKAMLRLDEAEKASMRAKDLTQQLLTFAKGGAPIKKTISIADILTDSATFALRGSNVRCRFEIAEDLCDLEIDEGQISQVMHNLIINAYQAMPDGGTITVRAENTTIWPDEDPDSTLMAGRFVRLSIIDEGHGIPPEVLPKIFDPYFTTKERGSGLGLATSYSILKNHDALVNVESEIGKGTIFNIYLPVSAKKRPKKVAQKDQPIQGHGRILVMDDEEMLRNFVGELLMFLGYEVKFAADGHETIDIYRKAIQEGKPFDCVLMDLTIPGGMGGRETIRKLLEMDPSVKAVVSSGYSDDPVMAEFRKYGFAGVVAKPYDAEQLSEVLHKVINC